MEKEKEIKIFCINVKTIRQHERLSKKEMAKILHIGTRSLTMIENGILPPRIGVDILMRIHRRFGFRPSFMVSTHITYDEEL